MNNSSTVTATPLNFKIVSKDQSDVLFITNNVAGENVTLQVNNQSGNPITYAASTSSIASQPNHHFEVRFRPGIIDLASINTIDTSTPGWTASASKSTLDGTVSVYLMKTGGGMIAHGELFDVILTNIKVDASRGSRSSNVQINYKNLNVQGTPFSGHDLERISIVSQVGLIEMPLQFYFREFNRILNDNTAQQLTLEFLNGSAENNIELTPQSQFIIKFDMVGPAALHTNPATIAALTIEPVSAGVFTVQPPDTQKNTIEWIISVNQDRSIIPNEVISFNIANIKSDKAGLTNMSIEYRNIVGYQGNMTILQIQRTPIYIASGANSEKVGIGTNNPTDKLHVHNGNSHFDGNIGVGTPNPNVPIQINKYFGIPHVQVQGTDSINATWRIATPKPGVVAFGGNYDHKIQLGGFDNNNTAFMPKLTVAPDGNVGFGIENPNARIDVNGDIRNSGDMKIGNNLFSGSGNIISENKGIDFSPRGGTKKITIDGNPFFQFWRYQNLGDSRTGGNTYNTTASVNEFHAIIAGFWTGNLDIYEGGIGSGVRVRMIKKNGFWHIEADMASQKNHDDWHVDVMFIRINLVNNVNY